jgi:hypothetical protein
MGEPRQANFEDVAEASGHSRLWVTIPLAAHVRGTAGLAPAADDLVRRNERARWASSGNLREHHSCLRGPFLQPTQMAPRVRGGRETAFLMPIRPPTARQTATPESYALGP